MTAKARRKSTAQKEAPKPGRKPSKATTKAKRANGDQGNTSSTASSKWVRIYSGIPMQSVEWLVDGLIPLKNLTIIAGNAGLGKSQLVASLAASVSKGRSWPIEGRACATGATLMVNAEDTPSEVIKPRLVAAGADLGNIAELSGVEDRDGTRPLNIETDIEYLRQSLETLPDCRLLVIDPLSAHLGGRMSNQDARIRDVIDPLSKIAEDYNLAVVLVTHLNKAQSQSYLHRIPGSIGLGAAVRAAYVVDNDPADDKDRLFFAVKNSYAIDSACFGFSIKAEAVAYEAGTISSSRIQFEPEMVPIPPEYAFPKTRSKGGWAVTQASEFLQRTLGNGYVESKELVNLAMAEGITATTLWRARTELGVEKIRLGNGQRCFALPKTLKRD